MEALSRFQFLFIIDKVGTTTLANKSPHFPTVWTDFVQQRNYLLIHTNICISLFFVSKSLLPLDWKSIFLWWIWVTKKSSSSRVGLPREFMKFVRSQSKSPYDYKLALKLYRRPQANYSDFSIHLFFSMHICCSMALRSMAKIILVLLDLRRKKRHFKCTYSEVVVMFVGMLMLLYYGLLDIWVKIYWSTHLVLLDVMPRSQRNLLDIKDLILMSNMYSTKYKPWCQA